MKIKKERPHGYGCCIDDLKTGDVFRFDLDEDDELFLLTDRRAENRNYGIVRLSDGSFRSTASLWVYPADVELTDRGLLQPKPEVKE